MPPRAAARALAPRREGRQLICLHACGGIWMRGSGRDTRAMFSAAFFVVLAAGAASPRVASGAAPEAGAEQSAVFGFSAQDGAHELALEQRFDGALDPSELRG